MHFTRLRLQGFKSFVEPTDLKIDAGMTGIVGPNGCGKSNLVEALKWVMGETSPRRMRGADMDDVIFAGTATRPSRNLAEVSLILDNTDRTAGPALNDADDVAITRKIERKSGSDYRLNGRPVRQRDVQLLFADQSTGAGSTSVVGQGQIDALIRAKPQERRQILEEASGTSGLQARRHEAELKLKGAESNLVRVDDVLLALDTQLRGLKQQVRQASRYRNLAEHIRRAEAALLRLRWVEAEGNTASTREALEAAEARTHELLSVVTQGNTARATVAAELPALRQTEAAASAIAQRLSLERNQIESEARRIEGEIAASQGRLTQAQADAAREELRLTDGKAACEKLAEEETRIKENAAGTEAKLPAFSAALDQASRDVTDLDAALAVLLKQAAEAEAREGALRREMDNLARRRTTLAERRRALDAERAGLLRDISSRPDLALAGSMVSACELELAKRQTQAQEAEQARREAEETLSAARGAASEAQTRQTKLTAEADAISAMLAHQDGPSEQVLDLISVTPGLESALAVALGEALTAGLDASAPLFWRELPAYETAPVLPEGAAALSGFIKAPPALSRALGQIGLVEDRASGEALAAALAPGQILVSRDGWGWRWDGYTASPEAKTATALRLQQRNRLAALEAEKAESQTALDKAKQALTEATALSDASQALDREARASLDKAFAALADARAHYAKQEREAEAALARMAALDDNRRALAEDLGQTCTRAATLEAEIAALPALSHVQGDIADKKLTLAEARARQSEARSERDRLVREREISATRLTAIAQESAAWQNRMSAAAQQSKALADRMEELTAALAELTAKPEALAQKLSDLMSALEQAEAKRRDAADILIAAEQRSAATEQKLRHDEAALASAREDRVRAEAAVEAAAEHLNTLRDRIAEKLNVGPDRLEELAEIAEGEAWPSIFELEQTLGRFTRERENMGPVNLRAEIESETVQAEIERITKEKEDLVAAIAKLRQGIGQLNREARERLQEAFVAVNERFQTLFQRLFGGGKAYLELIDNEDPMNAGLEIYAAPPGKKQQILSLLSGGERTLTALALLFAVFQTTPSPICVLDEAEAALDESNIGRFCELVQDIARETSTRFLIITHQRMTMAHMDRLYGVTMSEKGVSQLVSVDLAGAVALRDGKKLGALQAAEATVSSLNAEIAKEPFEQPEVLQEEKAA